jgi:hypothetical protein
MDGSNFDAIKANTIDDPDRAIFTEAAIEENKSVGFRMLRALLKGYAVSPLNCHEFSITPRHASIKNAASILNNAADTPLLNAWTYERVCRYWLEAEEIEAYHDPEEREIQAKKTCNEIESQQFYRRLFSALRLVRAVREFGISERYPFILEGLRTLNREIGEIIKKEGRMAKVLAANRNLFADTQGTEAANG